MKQELNDKQLLQVAWGSLAYMLEQTVLGAEEGASAPAPQRLGRATYLGGAGVSHTSPLHGSPTRSSLPIVR